MDDDRYKRPGMGLWGGRLVNELTSLLQPRGGAKLTDLTADLRCLLTVVSNNALICQAFKSTDRLGKGMSHIFKSFFSEMNCEGVGCSCFLSKD